jgi:serine/threonine protein kinase
MLHRDIKPQNVCLNDGWTHTPKVTLIDFGIAKSVSDMQANSVMTSNPGTNLFKAPEYMKKFIFGEKSELYAIGAVLACLLTGDSVFPRNSPDCSDEVAFMMLPEDVARPFASVISECSSTDRKKRKTVKELLHQIKDVRVLNGELENLSPCL